MFAFSKKNCKASLLHQEKKLPSQCRSINLEYIAQLQIPQNKSKKPYCKADIYMHSAGRKQLRSITSPEPGPRFASRASPPAKNTILKTIFSVMDSILLLAFSVNHTSFNRNAISFYS
jgi:hypothetical protein